MFSLFSFQLADRKIALGSDHFIFWGGWKTFFLADYFFQLMLQLDFFLDTPFEANFFFHKELKDFLK